MYHTLKDADDVVYVTHNVPLQWDVSRHRWLSACSRTDYRKSAVFYGRDTVGKHDRFRTLLHFV